MHVKYRCNYFCLAVIILAISSPTTDGRAILPPSTQDSAQRRVQPIHKPIHASDRKRHSRVWRVTKIASLLGPTFAIFLYNRLSQAYHKYEPFITVKLKESLQDAIAPKQIPYRSQNTFWVNSVSNTLNNPYVLKVANEVIRLVNRKLREEAVISRIQMDDDAYEFRRVVRSRKIANIAERVLHDVLEDGPGKFLDSVGKEKVRRLIRSSID